jgi:hypothetical protein
MSDRPMPPADPPTTPSDHARPQKTPHPDAMLCDRCRAEMFRMHAVWRCPACGYKTDCCGW